MMDAPTFDHERLDVSRLPTEYVAFSYRLTNGLTAIHRPARDQWLRAAQSIPLNIAEDAFEYEYRDDEYAYEENP
jgi:four helix bundle protein